MSRFRLILSFIAGALAAWVILAAEKPWTMDLANREDWKLGEIVDYYSFWAAVANLCVLAALIFKAGWWAAPAPTRPPSSAVPSPRWFWPLLVAAMIFCGASAAMRMNFGFVHDEDYSARRAIAGSYKLGTDGKVSLAKLRGRRRYTSMTSPTTICFTACWDGFAGRRGALWRRR